MILLTDGPVIGKSTESKSINISHDKVELLWIGKTGTGAFWHWWNNVSFNIVYSYKQAV